MPIRKPINYDLQTLFVDRGRIDHQTDAISVTH